MGVIAGIAHAEMIFTKVDPSLKAEWSAKDGDYIRKRHAIWQSIWQAFMHMVSRGIGRDKDIRRSDRSLTVETRTLEEVIEVLRYATQNKTSFTRIMLDNMVIPLPNGDVNVSMLKEAVDLINGRFETERSIDTFCESTRHASLSRSILNWPSKSARVQTEHNCDRTQSAHSLCCWKPLGGNSIIFVVAIS